MYSDSKDLEEKLEELSVQRKFSLEVLNKIFEEQRLQHGPVVIAATKLNANVISNLQKLLAIAKTVKEIKEKTVHSLTETIRHAIDELVHKVDVWLSRSSAYTSLAHESYSYSYTHTFRFLKIDHDEVQVR